MSQKNLCHGLPSLFGPEDALRFRHFQKQLGVLPIEMGEHYKFAPMPRLPDIHFEGGEAEKEQGNEMGFQR